MKLGLFILALLLILMDLSLFRDTAQARKQGAQGLQGTGAGPVVITSNSLESNEQEGIITFLGEVKAKRDDFSIDCEKMVVHLRKAPGGTNGQGTGDPEARIEKIVATGNVKIVRAEGGVATADMAVYQQQEETLVLTGNPVVREGQDSVEGDRITLFLKEERSVVEGSKDRRVKAVIFPREE